VTTLIGSEIDELDPFVARVLPRTVLALAVPALLLAWIGHLDLASAALAAVTLVIAPVLAGLVGADTAAAVRHRLASLERLGDRFDTLVEGLPLLRAFGRAADHERAVAASGEQVRTATLATLRIALLAGLVLELLAAVGTALVAVRLGLRLDAGRTRRCAQPRGAPQAGCGQEPGRAPPATVAAGRADLRPGPGRRPAAGGGTQPDHRRDDRDHRHARPSAAALGQRTIELRHGRLRPGERAAFLRDAR
jgi:ABC-type multidrug transport system fused ATPase/permease subunit